MKLISIICIYSILNFSVYAKKEKRNSINFFVTKGQKLQREYRFNKYENLISGTTAFLIGNIGYVTSNSEVLKIAYSGIQTIGLVNIGRSIYKIHSPSINKRFESFVTNKRVKSYSRIDVADELVDIYAHEDRAKRLSLFYSSSILAIQYYLNALVYETPDSLESTYLFLGSVNTIIAVYSALYKSDYEKHLFGEDFDINPFVTGVDRPNGLGLSISFSF